jgi:hypothetical protein
MNRQDSIPPAGKKLISYLMKRDPRLNERDVPHVLNSIKRFVDVVKKIYTEPQAQLFYKDLKIDGKTVRQRIIKTDFEELKKVVDNKTSQYPLEKAFCNLIEKVINTKIIRPEDKK